MDRQDNPVILVELLRPGRVTMHALVSHFIADEVGDDARGVVNSLSQKAGSTIMPINWIWLCKQNYVLSCVVLVILSQLALILTLSALSSIHQKDSGE